jgi:hypothetical protein
LLYRPPWGLLNPYIVLACVFLIEIGFAKRPAWSAVVPQLVSDEELPSAAILGSLQLNLSGIIGPVLGGMLLPLGIVMKEMYQISQLFG